MVKKIEIVKEDDKCDPALAAAVAKKMLDSGISIVNGHTCSRATGSALAVYGDKVIVFSPNSTAVSLTADGKFPNFFRATHRDDAQSVLNVKLIKKLGYRKVAVEVVLFETITPGQPSFDDLIAKVKSSGAQALLWGGYRTDAIKLLTQLRTNKVDITCIGCDALRSDAFLKEAGSTAEGAYIMGQKDMTNNTYAAAAVEDHQKRHPGGTLSGHTFSTRQLPLKYF